MLPNNNFWVLLFSGICLTTAFDVYVVPDQEIIDEVTEDDIPTEEVATVTEDLSDFNDITMGYGEYTTYMFQYENEQNLGMNKRDERCFDDYNMCLTSFNSGFTPLCAYNDQYPDTYTYLRTFRTICDMYLDNCFRQHRHWRIVDYGKCRVIGTKERCGSYGNTCPWWYLYFRVENSK